MDGVVDVLRFVNICATALLVGSLVFEYLVVVPTLNRLPLQTSAHVHRVMLGSLPNRFMPPSATLAMLTAIAVLVLDTERAAAATALYVAGTVTIALLSVSTIFFSMPANRTIAGWAPESVPAEYPQIRRSWDRLHAKRTTLGVLTLACYVGAGLAG